MPHAEIPLVDLRRFTDGDDVDVPVALLAVALLAYPDFAAVWEFASFGLVDDTATPPPTQLRAYAAAAKHHLETMLAGRGCCSQPGEEATAAPTACPASPVNDTTALAYVTGDHDGT